MGFAAGRTGVRFLPRKVEAGPVVLGGEAGALPGGPESGETLRCAEAPIGVLVVEKLLRMLAVEMDPLRLPVRPARPADSWTCADGGG